MYAKSKEFIEIKYFILFKELLIYGKLNSKPYVYHHLL